MSDKKKMGLFNKFIVKRTDGKDLEREKHDGCQYFVLDLTHDVHAPPAIRAYAESCESDYPILARDLRLLAPPLPPASQTSEPETPSERLANESVSAPSPTLPTMVELINLVERFHAAVQEYCGGVSPSSVCDETHRDLMNAVKALHTRASPRASQEAVSDEEVQTALIAWNDHHDTHEDAMQYVLTGFLRGRNRG